MTTGMMSEPVTASPPRDQAPAVGPQRARSDVCMLVEGTYPFVSGGVSSWVHDIIRGLPELSFDMVNIGSHPGSYGAPRFELPPNLRSLRVLFCRGDNQPAPLRGPERAVLDRRIRAVRRRPRDPIESRTLRGIRRLHLTDEVDDELIADLGSGDLELSSFLYGKESFELLVEISERLAPSTSFLDLFWHFRAMHVPLLRLLGASPPAASCYHAVSTGYAGLLGAVWSQATGRPFLVTEHGIYAREREMELSRAEWIRDDGEDDGLGGWAPAPSALRQLWSHMFRKLSRVAYHRADRVITLSDANRRKQIADGAPEHKIKIVPNGVRVAPVPGPGPQGLPAIESDGEAPDIGMRPLRVGFVGRVVPIKDVVTFIKACDSVLRQIPMDVRVIGPDDEDAAYAARCRALVSKLGREDSIRFLGRLPPAQIYAQLDVVVLTSFSEGQPLVILEAYAAGIPVIASDVGACREMVEGRSGDDRQLGPSGFVTRVAVPEDTARALILVARDPQLRRRLGAVGRQRVAAYYHSDDMLEAYQKLYREEVMS
jgi:glycosyltransferase involved in cell wall biosynthesis